MMNFLSVAYYDMTDIPLIIIMSDEFVQQLISIRSNVELRAPLGGCSRRVAKL